MEAQSFLKALFYNKPDENAWILVWEKGDSKVSHWFKNVEDAITRCKSHSKLQDTYVGCGTSPTQKPSYRRCEKHEISGIPGVWLDIDILDPAHKKENLPETPEKALEIINAFPLKPSIIVHSGHGFQCWWLFNQFLPFTQPNHREEAANMVHEFTWTMRDVARSQGYDIDMTFDLARVFRIPGSLNHKYPPPVPVTTMSLDDQVRYKSSKFRSALAEYRKSLGDIATPVQARQESETRQAVGDIDFKMDPNAVPPRIKFEALMEQEPRFVASWKMARKDFGDTSPSSYDMSLATFAVNAGWSIQEVVDLMIAFRRQHHLSQKIRADYFVRTFQAASVNVEKQHSLDELPAVSTGLPGETPEQRDVRIDSAKRLLSILIGVPIRRIIRYLVDPPEYKLETEQACIHLGTIQNLIEQQYFRRKVADATAHFISPMKSDKWNGVAQALLNSCESERIGDDSTMRGQIRSWLTSYLQYHDPMYDKDEAQLVKRPYYRFNNFYLFGPEFRQYIQQNFRELVNPKMMGIMLKEYGFESKQLNFKNGAKNVSRFVWIIPIEKDPVSKSFVDRSLLENANEQHLESKRKEKEESSSDVS